MTKGCMHLCIKYHFENLKCFTSSTYYHGNTASTIDFFKEISTGLVSTGLVLKVMQSKAEYRGKMSLIARNENLECVM